MFLQHRWKLALQRVGHGQDGTPFWSCVSAGQLGEKAERRRGYLLLTAEVGSQGSFELFGRTPKLAPFLGGASENFVQFPVLRCE
jgi:hypothetical protein